MEQRDAGAVLQELVHSMVELLVDTPGEVQVFRRDADETVVLDVSVVAKEIRFVIGKKGNTARALRTIVQGACAKLKVRCDLNIDNPGRVGEEMLR